MRWRSTFLAPTLGCAMLSACSWLFPLDEWSDGHQASPGGGDASHEESNGADVSDAPVEADSPTDVLFDAGDARADVDPCAACADAGGILCDDFECGLRAAWTDFNEAGGLVSIEAGTYHSPTHALLASADALDAAGAAISLNFWSQQPLPKHFWVRVYLLVPQTPPTHAEAFVIAQTLQGAQCGNTCGLELEIEQQSGILGASNWFPGGISYDSYPPTNLKGGWKCVEWEIAADPADASTGSMHVWVDSVLAMTIDSGLPMGPLDTFGVGMTNQNPGPQPALQIWIDDVRVDTKPIGCN